MKICPTCSQSYSDETLNFCLSDGAVLVQNGGGNADQATVFMQPGAFTTPTQGFVNTSPQTSPQQFASPTANNNWAQPQQIPQARPRKSRAGLWILGIIGGIVLISVIGFVGLVALVAVSEDTPDTTTFTNSTYKSVLSEDFSDWRREKNDSGKSEYLNNEFVLTSKQAGYFYVLVTSKKEFQSTNASTKVTVRNLNGTTTPLGYGLLIHSNPTVALASDYVFLIDSTTQSYRVAMHTSNKETNVIKWTKFNSIRTGTQSNDIEVKDENGKMTLFINGELATTLQNTTFTKDGIIGIYAGDAVPIAFSNLKLGK